MSDAAYFDSLASAIKTRTAPLPDFSDGPPERAEAGLAVYRNNVLSSLSKALAEKFPVVEQLVGEKFFKAMAQEYFAAHLPSSPLIVHYGDMLPAFLDKFEPAKSVSYLADMARLEIAWLRAYHSANAAALQPDEIVQAGDELSALKLTLHPSIQLLTSIHPIASIWRYNKAPAEHQKPTLGIAEQVLVFRTNGNVSVEVISTGVFAALEEIAVGRDIQSATLKAQKAEPDIDPQKIFQTLFANDLITGVSL